MVGVRGFEPPAPASRTQCSTRLSYTPVPGLPRRRGIAAPQRHRKPGTARDFVRRHCMIGQVTSPSEDPRWRGALARMRGSGMKSGMIAGIVAAMVGMAGTAVAQDVIAQRREGLRGMGRQMEAIKAVTDARGDTRPLVERIDTMVTFYQGLPAMFPAGSDTGDTRALADHLVRSRRFRAGLREHGDGARRLAPGGRLGGCRGDHRGLRPGRRDLRRLPPPLSRPCALRILPGDAPGGASLHLRLTHRRPGA